MMSAMVQGYEEMNLPSIMKGSKITTPWTQLMAHARQAAEEDHVVACRFEKGSDGTSFLSQENKLAGRRTDSYGQSRYGKTQAHQDGNWQSSDKPEW